MDQTVILEKASAIYNSDNPEGVLTSMGVTMKQSSSVVSNETSINLGGIELSGNSSEHTTYSYIWTFPNQISFSAIFSKEGLGQKFSKLFKKELQAGDSVFDDNVYIKTSDHEKCLATLTDRCQSAILNFVQQGGEVHVKKSAVTIKFNTEDIVSPNDMTEQHVLIAHFVQWALQA